VNESEGESESVGVSEGESEAEDARGVRERVRYRASKNGKEP